MTKQTNRILGKQGEEMAADLLKGKGYQILDQNNSTKWGELDLIVSKNNTLIFVEVKLKTTEDYGTPEEMIGEFKLAQVRRTAEMYLLNNPDIATKYEQYQIDAVCIVGPSGDEAKRITHYENLTF
ncbi:MAG: YraN family protein [bacterium]|nr:YraN family protein [bacterium]